MYLSTGSTEVVKKPPHHLRRSMIVWITRSPSPPPRPPPPAQRGTPPPPPPPPAQRGALCASQQTITSPPMTTWRAEGGRPAGEQWTLRLLPGRIYSLRIYTLTPSDLQSPTKATCMNIQSSVKPELIDLDHWMEIITNSHRHGS